MPWPPFSSACSRLTGGKEPLISRGHGFRNFEGPDEVKSLAADLKSVNALYYASSRRGGIYKVTADGETTKIADSPKAKQEIHVTLWIDRNVAYFLDNAQVQNLNFSDSNEKWKSINLDTLEIKDEPEFKVDTSAHQQQKYAFIGEGTVQDKIGYVTRNQVGSDGYIYFMTGSTHEGIKRGIYRVKVNSQEYELLVENENVSMFDVDNGVLSYYESDKTPPISKLQLKNN
ncbi:hypothetical protein DSBG_3252 [Desulfosporosinus sp. BG]|nr:hypothetical protein DSBG_3252 [Desulfosporosinus sp. BG]